MATQSDWDAAVPQEDWDAAKTQKAKISPLESGLRGAAQGFTAKFGDEINAAVEGGLHKLTGSDNFDPYDKAIEYYRKKNKQAEEVNPGAYTTGEVGANLVTGVAAPNKLAVSVAQGALNAAGGSDADSLKGRAKAAAIGGTVGAAGHGLAAGAGKLGHALLRRGGSFTANKVGPKIGALREQVSGPASQLDREALAQRLEQEVLDPLYRNNPYADSQRNAVAKSIGEIRTPPKSPVSRVGPAQFSRNFDEPAQREAIQSQVLAEADRLKYDMNHSGGTVNMRTPTGNVDDTVRTATKVREESPPLTLEDLAELKRNLQDKANYDVIKDTLGNANAKRMAAILREEEEAAFARGAQATGAKDSFEEFMRLKDLYEGAQRGVAAEARASKAGMDSLGQQILMGGGAALAGPKGAIGAHLARKYAPVVGHGLAYGAGSAVEATKGAYLPASRALTPELVELLLSLGVDPEKP